MGKLHSVLAISMSVLAVLSLSGCPREPRLNVSTNVLRFGVDPVTQTYITTLTFEVKNDGAADTTLVFAISANQPWIGVSPDAGTSTGANDTVVVTVTIDREFSNLKALEFAAGKITVEAGAARHVIDVTTAPDFFTEVFTGGNDLSGRSFAFTPNGGPSFYGATQSEVTDFPTDPTGGLVLDFGIFGDPIQAGLFGGEKVSFYGKEYDTLYIGSQGFVSFGAEGQPATTVGAHFATPQISALPVDADAAGSMVSYLQDADKLVITYENVPSAGKGGGTNDFQIELFFDGTTQVSYVNVDPSLSGVIGLSSGDGANGQAPNGFIPTDLSGVNTGPLKVSL